MKEITVDFTGVDIPNKEQEMSNYYNLVNEININYEKNKKSDNEMLGWLDIDKLYNIDLINDIKNTAKEIINKSDVFVVVGIGGSYLGARGIIELFKNYFATEKPEIIYAGNNMDGEYLEQLINYLKNKEFCINVISKSGKTLETSIAFRSLKKLLEDKYGNEYNKRVYVTTDEKDGILNKFVECEGFKKYVIPRNVGGRYSVLTPVGLLPIAVAGIDIEEILKGAEKAEKVYSNNDLLNNDCIKYAIIRNILYRKNKDIEIFASFIPKFDYLLEWCKQLFGESEGKDLKGIFPTSVLYSTDLHSLGQMVQEGKRNIFETFINVVDTKNSYKMQSTSDNIDGLSYLEGIEIDKINKGAFEGTLMAHVEGKVPSIVINIPEINEFYVGMIILFFEKACSISAKILEVNPFDQPGVELYKSNMMAIIKKYKKS